MKISKEEINKAFMEALRYNRLPIVSLLIDNGADVNYEQDFISFGVLPLMIAVTHSNIPMIEFLLSKGADPQKESKGVKIISHVMPFDDKFKEIKKLLGEK